MSINDFHMDVISTLTPVVYIAFYVISTRAPKTGASFMDLNVGYTNFAGTVVHE
jgi:hypothetical protein